MGALSRQRRAASTAHANRPFVTDASSGLRTELSGVVFEQWVAKTTNWLESEFDAELRLHLELRAHWLWPVFVAALDELEGTLVDEVDADAIVTLGARADATKPVIAIHEHPMAMPFREALPPHHLDYFLLVRGGADVRAPGPAHDAPLLIGAASYSAADLLELAPVVADGARIAMHSSDVPIRGAHNIAALVLTPWKHGASIVIADGSSAIDGERCTATLTLG